MMTGFFMAWGMFTIIPCPRKVWDNKKFSSMLLSLPLIGIMIGFLWMAVFLLLNTILLSNGTDSVTNFLSAVIMIITPWILSGFIHLDGFLDCSDAVLSRRCQEERIRILKDSTVGAFAVIMFGIHCMLSLGIFSAVSFHGRAWVLILIPTISRACSSFSLLVFNPLQTSSYQSVLKDKNQKHTLLIAVLELSFLIVLTLAISLFYKCVITSIFSIVEITSFFATICVLKKNLGGISGDISGCAITISELLAVASLIFI